MTTHSMTYSVMLHTTQLSYWKILMPFSCKESRFPVEAAVEFPSQVFWMRLMASEPKKAVFCSWRRTIERDWIQHFWDLVDAMSMLNCAMPPIQWSKASSLNFILVKKNMQTISPKVCLRERSQWPSCKVTFWRTKMILKKPFKLITSCWLKSNRQTKWQLLNGSIASIFTIMFPCLQRTNSTLSQSWSIIMTRLPATLWKKINLSSRNLLKKWE